MSVDLGGISTQLDTLHDEAKKLRLSLDQENVKRDKQIRNNRILLIVVSVVIAVSLVVGVLGILSANKANKAVAAVVAERTERKIEDCNAANASRIVQINAEKIEIRNLSEAVAPEPRDLKTQLLVAQFLKSQDLLIEKSHPIRDCSFSALGVKPLTSTTTTSTTTKKAEAPSVGPGSTQGSSVSPVSVSPKIASKPQPTTTTTIAHGKHRHKKPKR